MSRLSLRKIHAPATIMLALASIGLPLLAFAVYQEPLGVPFDDPARVAYYRWTVFTLIAGAVSGLAAMLLGGWSRRPIFKGIGMALGGLGLFVGASLLLVLTGLCGPGVLTGYCSP